LDRSNSPGPTHLLSRSGWGGIAVGRATPGLRYATVIACGLLKVPYLRFLTAQLVGSSVYIVAFLALGAIFGPAVIDRIHLPVLAVRLLCMVPLAVGLPLVMVFGVSRLRHPEDSARGGAFLGWLVGTGPHGRATTLLVYIAVLLLPVGISAAYYEFVLPYLALGGLSRLWQAFGLSLSTLGVFGVVPASSAFIRREELLDPWWQTGGPVMVCGVAFGVAIYALTAVYGRVLAIAAVPALRSRGA
jgi:hypothetical protein